jgi:hypothetical protein
LTNDQTEVRKKIFKDSIWITNGITQKRIHKTEIIPNGWNKGRLDKEMYIKSMSIVGLKSKDTIWITDGLKNKKINKNDNIPDGWKKGFLR